MPEKYGLGKDRAAMMEQKRLQREAEAAREEEMSVEDFVVKHERRIRAVLARLARQREEDAEGGGR